MGVNTKPKKQKKKNVALLKKQNKQVFSDSAPTAAENKH